MNKRIFSPADLSDDTKQKLLGDILDEIRATLHQHREHGGDVRELKFKASPWWFNLIDGALKERYPITSIDGESVVGDTLTIFDAKLVMDENTEHIWVEKGN